jgi:hypothetical protein
MCIWTRSISNVSYLAFYLLSTAACASRISPRLRCGSLCEHPCVHGWRCMHAAAAAHEVEGGCSEVLEYISMRSRRVTFSRCTWAPARLQNMRKVEALSTTTTRFSASPVSALGFLDTHCSTIATKRELSLFNIAARACYIEKVAGSSHALPRSLIYIYVFRQKATDALHFCKWVSTWNQARAH